MQLKLDSLDGKQESENLVVPFDGVLVQKKVERPLYVVIQGEPTPRVLLVGLIRAREWPVLQKQSIVQIGCLVSETQESWPIIHWDKISQFKLHLDDWIFDVNLLVATHKVSVHERNFQFFIFFVVVDDHLTEVVIHEINVRVIVREDLFLS